MSRNVLTLHKKEILDIYNYALAAVKPESMISHNLEIISNNLTLKDFHKQVPMQIDLSNTNVHVIGGGKSVFGMALGLSHLVRGSSNNIKFSRGALSIPIDLKPSLNSDLIRQLSEDLKIQIFYGSKNNLPDEDSVRASQLILDGVTRACEEDLTGDNKSLFLVLISGGGSACLTNPKYINLAKKLSIIKHLVQKGADIIELNKVRRYFSKIKGGQLAAHILRANPSAKIITMIMSDVIGDRVEYIASGPTVMNENSTATEHFRDMCEVLTKYDYSDIQSLVAHPESEDSRANAPLPNGSSNIVNIIIGNNRLAREAAADRAQQLGYHVVHLDRELSGPTQDIVSHLIGESYKIPPPTGHEKLLTIGGGEAIVEKKPNEVWGVGGRAQEMALDYMLLKLRSADQISPEETDIFLAGGTDGQDGPTDSAGCLASHSEYLNSKTFSLGDILEAKTAHNSHEFWKQHKLDWLIKSGLTGTNVMDLYLHSRYSSA